MKNETVTSMQLTKVSIADLTQLQGGTVRSWSSLVLQALQQQTLQKAEMIK